MSIVLPVRRRRPAPEISRVCRPKERPLSALPAIVEFVTAPVSILLGASFFTRKVQAFEGGLVLQQGAVGRRLADRTHSRSNGLDICVVLLVTGECGLSRRPRGEAEGGQR
jgi:hypothetical protein